MTADEYIKTRVDDQIEWFDRTSSKNQKWYKRLRLAEIVAAASIPVVAGNLAAQTPYMPIAVGALGAFVAVVAAVLSLNQYQQNWIQYRSTCEALKAERLYFLTETKPYAGRPEERFQLFVQRIEALLSQEQQGWAQYMVQAGEEADAG